MTKMGRPVCIKMSPGISKQVTLVLDSHLVPPLESVARYRKIQMRRRPVWQEIYRNRAVVTDLLNASGGYQLPQKAFEKVAETWHLQEGNFEADAEDIVKFVYRCRVQMAHLRYANLNGWTPPTKFQALRGLIQIARIDDPSSSCREQKQAIVAAIGDALEEASHDDDDDDDDDVVSMPDNDDCDMVSVASGDDDCTVVSSKIVTEDLDDVISRMFLTPEKEKKTQTADSSQKKKSTAKLAQNKELEKDTAADFQINYDTVDKIVKDGTIAHPYVPTTSGYTRMFKKTTVERLKKRRGRGR